MDRKRQRKYDETHTITVSTRLTRHENAALEAYCIAHKITRYRLIKDGITLYLATKEGGQR